MAEQWKFSALFPIFSMPRCLKFLRPLVGGECFFAPSSLILIRMRISIRDFVYGYSVTGRKFATVDHFSAAHTNPEYWLQSPSAIAHLPQNKLEGILRANIASPSAQLLFGHQVKYIVRDETRLELALCRSSSTQECNAVMPNDIISEAISCDYLIGADGSSSIVRQFLGITMHGAEAMQTLVNVHFKSQGLQQLLHPRPAMLYFVFNEVSGRMPSLTRSQKSSRSSHP